MSASAHRVRGGVKGLGVVGGALSCGIRELGATENCDRNQVASRWRSGTLKACRISLVIGVRTSEPVQSHRDLVEQERVLADRRHKVLYAVMQMNGGRGIREDLADSFLSLGRLAR